MFADFELVVANNEHLKFELDSYITNNESTDLDHQCSSDSTAANQVGPTYWFVKIVFFIKNIPTPLC